MKNIFILIFIFIVSCKKNNNTIEKITSKDIAGYWKDTAYNRYFLNKIISNDSIINQEINYTKFHYNENYSVEFISNGLIFPLGKFEIFNDTIRIYETTNDSLVFKFGLNDNITQMNGFIKNYGFANLIKE
jgi:hypothetical protein